MQTRVFLHCLLSHLNVYVIEDNVRFPNFIPVFFDIFLDPLAVILCILDRV